MTRPFYAFQSGVAAQTPDQNTDGTEDNSLQLSEVPVIILHHVSPNRKERDCGVYVLVDSNPFLLQSDPPFLLPHLRARIVTEIAVPATRTLVSNEDLSSPRLVIRPMNLYPDQNQF